MNKYVIPAPTHLCLYDSAHVNHTIFFFNNISNITNKKDTIKVCIDFSQLIKLTAAAANYMFSFFTYFQIEKNNNILNFKLPKNPEMKRLFINAGFARAIRAGGIKKIENLWDDSSFICGNNQDVSKLLTVIKQRSNMSNLPKKLTAAIRETLLNINHHAYNKDMSNETITWWCYFHLGDDESGKYLSAVIFDRGEGIPSRIRRAFPYQRNNFDDECISYAMIESVTSTKELGRGKGSVDMKNPIKFNNISTKDQLFVISLKGKYSYEFIDGNDKVDTGMLDYALNGTMIEWILYY